MMISLIIAPKTFGAARKKSAPISRNFLRLRAAVSSERFVEIRSPLPGTLLRSGARKSTGLVGLLQSEAPKSTRSVGLLQSKPRKSTTPVGLLRSKPRKSTTPVGLLRSGVRKQAVGLGGRPGGVWAGGGARFLYSAWAGRRIANDAKTTAFVILRFRPGRAMNVSRPQTGPPPRAGQAAGPKGVPHDHLR